MSKDQDKGPLLGRKVAVTEVYSPQLLHPVPRETSRAELGLRGAALPFTGEDIWHAYELSWLDETGKPRVFVGRIRVPADSPMLIESKSLKLYLNSLNGERYSDDAEVAGMIARDLGRVAQAPVTLDLLSLDDASFGGRMPDGTCIDEAAVSAPESGPDRALLRAVGGDKVTEALYTQLMRSLCPVTGQPDWATLCISYSGRALDHASLLRYIIAFRAHQDFHEQCVERIFCDLLAVCEPAELSVQALYTRRGGLDICPWRTTTGAVAPLWRLNRQ